MAEILQLSRNTKVFIKDNEGTPGGFGSDQMWEIPVLDGYSFSQATEASEVTLKEAADSSNNSRRGKAVFNTALAPVEWSFTTYIRPFISTGIWTSNSGVADSAAKHHAVEDPLWAYFVNGATIAYTPLGEPSTAAAWSDGVTFGNSDMVIDFTGSNKTALRVFELYFCLGANAPGGAGPYTTYKLMDACVNQAVLNFDIEGIATIEWSGYAKQIVHSATDPSSGVTTRIFEATDSTNTFIRQRLTTVTVTNADGANFPGSPYTVVLTGGNITLSNNITYLTPAELAKVNIPLGHVTGTRSVSGSFTAYLNDDQVGSSTGQLYADLAAAIDVTTNAFALDFSIGGASAPKVAFAMDQAHLEIPKHNIADVIGLEVTFAGLPSGLGATDEATITYVGVTPV